MYSDRYYRAWAKTDALEQFLITIGESDLLISCSRPLRRLATTTLRHARAQVEEAIAANPALASSLWPLPLPTGAPPVVRAMADAGEAWRVGPMAAVAGAIAQAVGQQLATRAEWVIVENGGDVFVKAPRPVRFLLYAGERSPFAARVGFEIEARDGLGVCTSSAVVGPSLSLGQADAVVAIAPDAAFADAAATAIANRIGEPGDVARVVEEEKRQGALSGLLACCGDQLGVFGDLTIVPGPGAARIGQPPDPLRPTVQRDPARCVHCTACVGHCRRGALTVARTTALVRLAPSLCRGCGQCVSVCAYGALQIGGEPVGKRVPFVHPSQLPSDLGVQP